MEGHVENKTLCTPWALLDCDSYQVKYDIFLGLKTPGLSLLFGYYNLCSILLDQCLKQLFNQN